MTVNAGALNARLVSSFIKDDQTYFIVGVVSAVALVIAAGLFIIGWRHYIDAKPYDSVIMTCIPVVINAFRTRRQYKKQKRLDVAENRDSVSFHRATMMQGHIEGSVRIQTDQHAPTFLDFAKVPNGGKFHERIVNDVKSLRNAFIVFGFLIPYLIIYYQARSFKN